MSKATRVLVTGAGGFIGHHLVKALVQEGYWVRGVDIKEPDFEPSLAQEFELLDLRRWESCQRAAKGMDEVYNLAANMGGIGFISANKAEIMHDNVLINTHMLEAAHQTDVSRYLYTSSACIYPMYRQTDPDCAGLKEEEAYPADAEDGYGWEKLFSGAPVQALLGGIRLRDAHRALPQYFRGRSALSKADARSHRRPSVANSRWPSPGDEIEIWGRRETDPVVLLYRRLRRRNHALDALGAPRADQPRPGPHDLDRRARQHRRRYRRQGDQAPLQPEQAPRRSRTQQRQQPPSRSPGLGAPGQLGARSRAHLLVDQRPDRSPGLTGAGDLVAAFGREDLSFRRGAQLDQTQPRFAKRPALRASDVQPGECAFDERVAVALDADAVGDHDAFDVPGQHALEGRAGGGAVAHRESPGLGVTLRRVRGSGSRP